jgi:hypothetical protein
MGAMKRIGASRCIAVASAVCGAAAVSAQPPLYRDVTASNLPADVAGACMNAAAGDADGDGDLDLALAMEFQPKVLLLNDGAGRFANGSNRLPRAIHDSEDVAFADFDRDGDLDLVFVSEDDRSDELYLNDGSARFSDASARLATDDVSNALAVLDLDGDGAPDLLTGNIGTDRALIGDGRGGFRDETAERWRQDGESRTQDLELADVDGDGDLDVLVGNEGQNQLFLNEKGRLVDVTARSLPVRSDETRKIRAADVDGDGDVDLIVANVRFGMQESAQDYVLLNDGAGRFSAADTARLPQDERDDFTIQTVDVDRDGDVDVLAPSTVFPDVENDVLLFVTGDSDRALVVRADNLDMKDTDGDGDLDAIALVGDRMRAFRNDNGRFVAGADVREGVIGVQDDDDFDGDGEPDVATANVLLHAGAAAGERSRSTSVTVLDLDRDGDVDGIVQTTLVMDRIGDYLALLNDGHGRFTAAPPGTVLPPGADGNGFDVEVADFDADGIPDLFLCNRASTRQAEISGGVQRLLLGERVRRR